MVSVHNGCAFVDGSGMAGLYPELRSTGWSVIVFDEERRLRARYYGAVPRIEGPSQVARDGEDYSILQCSKMVMGTYQVKSDCKGSVRCCHDLDSAAGPKNLRSHIWKRTRSNEDFHQVIVSHVKAHTTMSDVREGVISSFDRDGNALADKYAKEGAKIHGPSEAAQQFVRGAERLHVQLLSFIARFEVWFHEQDEDFRDYLFPEPGDPDGDRESSEVTGEHMAEDNAPWPWLIQNHALLEYRAIHGECTLLFCTSCCKYLDVDSKTHRGLDNRCVGKQGGTGRIVENLRHFNNRRHPQSCKKHIKLMDPCRPTADSRAKVCKAKKWQDPLVLGASARERTTTKRGPTLPQRLLDTVAICNDCGLSYDELIKLGEAKAEDADEEFDFDAM